MNSNEYKIERWDVIYDEKANIKRPLGYFVPDKELIEFAEINKFSLYATIKDTGIECYDNIRLPVEMESLSKTRPNLFEKTGYYTLYFKDAIWLGYPRKMGSVVFEGVNKLISKVENKDESKEETKVEESKLENIKPTEEANKEYNIKGFNIIKATNEPSNIIIIIGILLFLVLVVRFGFKIYSEY